MNKNFKRSTAIFLSGVSLFCIYIGLNYYYSNNNSHKTGTSSDHIVQNQLPSYNSNNNISSAAGTNKKNSNESTSHSENTNKTAQVDAPQVSTPSVHPQESPQTASLTNSSKSQKTFSLSSYISNLESETYTIKQGETLSTIAHTYEQYCNPNSTVKLISLLNNLASPDDLEIGTKLRIPEKAITTGTLYTVAHGDTWYTISSKYYPNYNTDSIMNFIVKINNLPNNDLPLGEKVFLPKV